MMSVWKMNSMPYVDYFTDYIIVLLCDDFPNQKYWTDSGWVSNYEIAKEFNTHISAGKELHNVIPKELITYRAVIVPKSIYKLELELLREDE